MRPSGVIRVPTIGRDELCKAPYGFHEADRCSAVISRWSVASEFAARLAGLWADAFDWVQARSNLRLPRCAGSTVSSPVATSSCRAAHRRSPQSPSRRSRGTDAMTVRSHVKSACRPMTASGLAGRTHCASEREDDAVGTGLCPASISHKPAIDPIATRMHTLACRLRFAYGSTASYRLPSRRRTACVGVPSLSRAKTPDTRLRSVRGFVSVRQATHAKEQCDEQGSSERPHR